MKCFGEQKEKLTEETTGVTVSEKRGMYTSMVALGDDAGAFRCRHALRNDHFAGFFDVARVLVFLDGLEGNELEP